LEKTNDCVILYTYDVDGSLISFNYLGTEYFYVKDILGNIVRIIDATGTTLVEYQNDAYGNTLYTLDNSGTLNLSHINPYRYRFYRYDEEISYYYCNTRYYQPMIGRWLNADHVAFLDPEGTGELNLFGYCVNNPVMYSDPSGEILITTIILIITILAGAGMFTYTAVDSYNKTGQVDWLGSTVNGLMTFVAVYSLGIYAYNCYLMLSLAYGLNPVIGIGAGGFQYYYNNVLNNSAHVVRGGMSAVDNLQTNMGDDARGYISARSGNEISIDTLATTPRPFLNGQISVTTVGAIRSIGMNVVADPTIGNPYHVAIVPNNVALEKLSELFEQMKNTWR